MRAITSMVADSQLLRRAVQMWKQELPRQDAALQAINELREQTATLLDKRAEAWIGENKLVHAGAARKLAAELRAKL